jgi:DNA-binding CsgD family transcriptional regulator
MFDDYTSLSTDTKYVIDFFKRRFSYIPLHDLFLCGYSREEVMQWGYNFYREIVHPDDLQLLIKIHRVILNCSYITEKELQNNIRFLCFTVRRKNYPCSIKTTHYLMVCCKILPLFINGKIRYGYCVLSISTMPTSGNLRIYFNDRKQYEEYSFRYNMWSKAEQNELLTDREIEILKSSTQGLNTDEIANRLCISRNTLEHAITALLSKFPGHIKTVKDAIIYASNLLLLYDHKEKNDSIYSNF